MITASLLQSLLKSLAGLCFFLLIGIFLHRKIRFFQNFFLPPSVIGGFLALFCSPQILHHSIPFLGSLFENWQIVPAIFIVPVFVATPLGLQLKITDLKKMLPQALVSCGLFSVCASAQMVVGFGVALLGTFFFPSLTIYSTFGYELSQGFAGGHATAGAVGNLLQNFGFPYWQTAQGITAAFATIGLFFGMIIGFFLIQRAVKNKQTAFLYNANNSIKTAQNIPQDCKSDSANCVKKVIPESSIITIGIVLVICAASYYVLDFFRQQKIAMLSAIPVWFYGILLMYAVNFLFNTFNIMHIVNVPAKTRMVGFLSDLAIIAALASIPVKIVFSYLAPILIMSILGFMVTYIITFPLGAFFFGKRNFYFERGIMSWGMNTGVMINGMMLLKICDPQLKSPVLQDFSLGFSLMIITSFIISPITYNLLAFGSLFYNFCFALVTVFFYLLLAFVGKYFMNKNTKT